MATPMLGQLAQPGAINLPYSGAKYNWATQSPPTGPTPNSVTPLPGDIESAPIGGDTSSTSNVAATPSTPAFPMSFASYGGGGDGSGIDVYQEGGPVDDDDDQDLGQQQEQGQNDLADTMASVKQIYQYGASLFGLLPKQGGVGVQQFQGGGSVDEEGPPQPQPDEDVTGSVTQPQERGVPWLNRALAPIFTSGMSRDDQGALQMEPQAPDQGPQEDPSAGSIDQWKGNMNGALAFVKGLFANNPAEAQEHLNQAKVDNPDTNVATVKSIQTLADQQGPEKAFKQFQYYRNFSDLNRAHASNLLQRGDLDGSINNANIMADYIPNGNKMTFAKSGDGVTATVQNLADPGSMPQSFQLSKDQYANVLKGGFDPLYLNPTKTLANADQTAAAPVPTPRPRGIDTTGLQQVPTGRPVSSGQWTDTGQPIGRISVTPGMATLPTKSMSEMDVVPKYLQNMGVTQDQWDSTRATTRGAMRDRVTAALALKTAEQKQQIEQVKAYSPMEVAKFKAQQDNTVTGLKQLLTTERNNDRIQIQGAKLLMDHIRSQTSNGMSIDDAKKSADKLAQEYGIRVPAQKGQAGQAAGEGMDPARAVTGTIMQKGGKQYIKREDGRWYPLRQQ